jgi:hypothetical protein
MSNENQLISKSIFTALLLTVFAIIPVTSNANADSFDVELDPLAFMLNGYSLHLGHSSSLGRIDVGVFGLELPEAMIEVESFEAKFAGYGMKWDLQEANHPGWFIGAELNSSMLTVTDSVSLDTTTVNDYSAGIRNGYRFIFGKFTVSPWIGLDYLLSDTSEISLGSEKWEREKLIVFPTVHIGRLL